MRLPRFEPGIRIRDIWVKRPPQYPLRYGGQCNLAIYAKVINRRVGKMCNLHPHPRKSNALGKHMYQQNLCLESIGWLR